jgi:hypothetical protein
LHSFNKFVFMCACFFLCALYNDDKSTRNLVCVALNALKMMNWEGIAWNGRGVITRRPIFSGRLRKITANIKSQSPWLRIE